MHAQARIFALGSTRTAPHSSESERPQEQAPAGRQQTHASAWVPSAAPGLLYVCACLPSDVPLSPPLFLFASSFPPSLGLTMRRTGRVRRGSARATVEGRWPCASCSALAPFFPGLALRAAGREGRRVGVRRLSSRRRVARNGPGRSGESEGRGRGGEEQKAKEAREASERYC